MFIPILLLTTSVLMSVSGLGAHTLCNLVPGLSARQRHICLSQGPVVMATVGQGDALALAECRHQFRHHRWNCSSGVDGSFASPQSQNRATRETAFTHAIRTAAVAYRIAQECSYGNLTSCGTCDNTGRKGRYIDNGWEWEGCNDHIEYGLRFARKFLDAREVEETSRALMNKHNNAAGRKSIKDSIETKCKCHGTSGTCTIQTCWSSLPRFRAVGDMLQKRYSKAKAVIPIKAGRARKPRYLKLRATKRIRNKPRRIDLVYLEQSPSYCEVDPSTGSLGTEGRQCNKTARDMSGCDLLCCGRGYNTMRETVTEQCHCKFHWCCSVTCELCTREQEIYTCK